MDHMSLNYAYQYIKDYIIFKYPGNFILKFWLIKNVQISELFIIYEIVDKSVSQSVLSEKF